MEFECKSTVCTFEMAIDDTKIFFNIYYIRTNVHMYINLNMYNVLITDSKQNYYIKN